MRKIEIELIGSYGRLLERAPVFITDDLFKIEIKTGYQLSDIVVEFKNGDKKITKHFSNKNELAIPPEILFAGKLEIVITLIACGVALKCFTVEPIILKEINSAFEAYSEVAELERQLAQKDEEITALKAFVGVLQESLTDLQHQVGRLWEIQES